MHILVLQVFQVENSQTILWLITGVTTLVPEFYAPCMIDFIPTNLEIFALEHFTCNIGLTPYHFLCL
uniref:Uncharacterized protein n=1 Tax=Anguilla anguilla TaxID=7936 RepID=A0A0E9XJN1_ANGAN